MPYWFKHKYDFHGNHRGRVVISASSAKEANEKMELIEGELNYSWRLGRKIHGPYATEEKAKTSLL
ncbi:MAG: hypothetical protein A3C58_03215 [Candidatus Staskawiczbacteria bacterium RIFCSPHIGHO2_02_FULL_34_10]|uniref:Uncharacterized protein n=2 Tax=Candidatus Staskawicziibacteriota TaxID=1817916 RepID=A0A1G2HIV0_9BACT|nr:MAG: hypothetical protein A2639_01095 [Candidatus Staskawiczbacteria bacterium RIFCSPHIGHO2_01_FULL_34_27]OGZ67798.1 MAG: hypothetical protein A3C58_03215 [Candidatus Staskawiczbacteria bacterium RIFCSPHIGHO2_02_FULL_34_10]